MDLVKICGRVWRAYDLLTISFMQRIRINPGFCLFVFIVFTLFVCSLLRKYTHCLDIMCSMKMYYFFWTFCGSVYNCDRLMIFQPTIYPPPPPFCFLFLRGVGGREVQKPAKSYLSWSRAEELCESRGGRPWHSVTNSSYRLCERKATVNQLIMLCYRAILGGLNSEHFIPSHFPICIMESPAVALPCATGWRQETYIWTQTPSTGLRHPSWRKVPESDARSVCP